MRLPGRFDFEYVPVMTPDKCEAIYIGPSNRAPWLQKGSRYWVERVLDNERQKRGSHQLWTAYRDGFGGELQIEVTRGDLEFIPVE